MAKIKNYQEVVIMRVPGKFSSQSKQTKIDRDIKKK